MRTITTTGGQFIITEVQGDLVAERQRDGNMVKIIKSRDRELIDKDRDGAIDLELRLDQMESKLFTSFGHEKSVYSDLFTLIKSLNRRLKRLEKTQQA